jgi:ribonuclease HI
VADQIVFIYADESCLGNQFRDRARPGGAGALIEYHHPDRGWVRRDYWMSEPDTTNNRMALVSAADLLAALKRPGRVVFTSDSRYLIDGMTKWMHGWAARGWTRKGGEIENLEMWKTLAAAAARHEVEWRWVKGHAGHPQNEYANFLATRAAAKQMASDGLIESGFGEWLKTEREKGHYLDFFESEPRTHDFGAARQPLL